MKKIFRKNQLIITALALMIAVAGYFSYMNNNIDDGTAAASAGAGTLEEEYEISDEDSYIEGEIFTDEGDVVIDPVARKCKYIKSLCGT